jgi:sulfide:quinone oxidoreductase
MAKVVILGGGFGGLAAAHELRPLLGDNDEITLIDRSDRFHMGFAKLWDLAGIRALADGTRRLARLQERGIRFLQAAITAVDPTRRQVTIEGGTVTADALLVALGATANPAHLALLAGQGAHDLYDWNQLPGMRQSLGTVTAGRVVVSILGTPFKCPPAPYEAALIVDGLLRQRGVRDAVDVTVTTPQPAALPVAGPDASRFVADRLGDHGIGLLSGHPVTSVTSLTSVSSVTEMVAQVAFGDGSALGYSTLLGVPGTLAPLVLRETGLVGESGWIEPDIRTFRTGFDRVYAVGDCTLVPNATGQLPKAGVFAAAEGRVAARNIAADLVGGPEASFDGRGHCFLELPGRKVAFVEGNFLAEPAPDVHITDATEERYDRKQAYERDLLDAWLG